MRTRLGGCKELHPYFLNTSKTKVLMPKGLDVQDCKSDSSEGRGSCIGQTSLSNKTRGGLFV